ncbi:MAG: NTP transferase domain-containing protein [Candidatus Rokuibacteriota bacterium]
MSEQLRGGIIAAGEGRRLREDGFGVPKPLVSVGGVPLLESVIGNFVSVGIGSITAIVNDDHRQCVDWASGRFGALDLRFIVKTTASSLESFLTVLRHARPGPLLVSTVDAWCPRDEFAAFVAAARRRPADAVVLGVTPLVADERPLWARLGTDGRVTELGGRDGDAVTAGLYLIPERLRGVEPPPGLARLRDFLGWLARGGEPVYAEVVPTVVDVDRGSDVALAESLVPQVAKVCGL